jgi:hypothetical protein
MPLIVSILQMVALFFVQVSSAQNFLAQENATKVFWMNIGGGGYKSSPSQKPQNLDLELLNYVSKEKPEVMVLAEYVDTALHQKTIETLAQNYFRIEVPYSVEMPEVKMLVLSKRRVLNLNVSKLDWVPEEWTESQKSEYRAQWYAKYASTNSFTRPLLHLTVEGEAGPFDVFAAHFANPWKLQLKASYGLSLPKTLKDIYLSESNPHFYQVSNFKELLHQKLDPNRPSYMVMDLNSFESFQGRESKAYSKVSQGLQDELKNTSAGLSFPAMSVLGSPVICKVLGRGLRIDHAFSHGTKNTKAQKVLLRGSDHWAIEIK